MELRGLDHLLALVLKLDLGANRRVTISAPIFQTLRTFTTETLDVPRWICSKEAALGHSSSRCRTHLVINVGVRSDVGSIDDLTVRHGDNDQLPDIGGAAPQTVVTLEDTERSREGGADGA